MLDDLTLRRKAAKDIVSDAMRGEDGDPFGELNSLDRKFFGAARVSLQIPLLDHVVMRECLRFIAEELPGVIAEMDRINEPRSKALLVQSRLKRWNHAFARRIKR